MQELLSKNADIGFSGPEQVIYIYNQKREDYPVLFAELTQTDGSFLIGRNADKNFKWEDLKGKSIIGGRPGGIPEMALENVLKAKGLVPGKNINLVTNIAYTATAGAFQGGTGDYVALFEPTGSMLEKEKKGYIVASIGKEIGAIPETCYYATKSYINKYPDRISKFTKALYKGQQWVKNNSDKDVAEKIKSFFPGTDINIITSCVKNYRGINAYASDPILNEKSLDSFMNIIQGYKADLIPQKPPYDKIVNTKFAKDAIK